MSATDASLVVTVGVSSALVVTVVYVWTALALGAVFRKSGEQSWKAWVPILNLAVLLQLGGFSGWLVLLLLLPVLGGLLVWVAMIVACHRIGREFGFGAGMTVLAALLLPVWASVIGFGSARWVGTDDAGPRRSVNPDLGGAVDDFDDRVYGVPTARGAVYTPLLPAPDYAGSHGGTRSEASWDDTVRGSGEGDPAGADLTAPELDEDSSTDEARRSSSGAPVVAAESNDTAPIARGGAGPIATGGAGRLRGSDDTIDGDGAADLDDAAEAGENALAGLFAEPDVPRFTPPVDGPEPTPAPEPASASGADGAASDPFSIPSWPAVAPTAKPETPVRSGPVWPSVEPFRPVRSWDPEPVTDVPAAAVNTAATDAAATDAAAPAAPRGEGASGPEVVAEAVIRASAEEPGGDAGDAGPAPSRAEIRRSESVWNGFVLDQDVTGEVTGAVTGAPAPIAAVPGAVGTRGSDDAADRSGDETEGGGVPGIRRRSADPDEVDAGRDAAPASSAPLFQAPLTRVPPANPAPSAPAAPAPTPSDDEPWRPAHSPIPESEPFPETSGPVSAIAGAPVAGAPRAAGGAVSAQYARPGVPDLGDGLDQTIVARRRRTNWAVVTPAGESIAISSDVAILGRRPAPDAEYPRAQLIRIDDSTVSSTHARLELRKDTWYITDLGSTNGVVFATLMGTEVEAPSGVEVEAGDRFFLGDAEIRLVRSNS